FEVFEKLLDESEIIISHGGAGCIADGLERNKPVVVVPRLSKCGEASNDNQVGLTNQLAKEGRILAVYDINELESAIEKARHFNPSASKSENRIVKIISDYLAELKH
nr:glycosyltransferase family 28 [bacterium]